ncbi:uncharacterized protein Z520_07982 [Fonsecaea multimorphosa CBS 102226]|uniref:Transcription factor domain-containing protein n=1 Tax=Fonsecaea multimorphosa CBS 102226 TaxID=1442371 RepID=A0A0D2JZZ3_9EURO|nr:uncharacterized protein Z520_07982 [Fonsecaea multimorphosa CBS 102226]KIX96204.1 hypothetical protein Z520_07982 [Fonsecaea multimorphosa CBS 102226]OAL22219.1 hypothetical protein AYO22_07263 [Fonsecaea multimorphosa]
MDKRNEPSHAAHGAQQNPGTRDRSSDRDEESPGVESSNKYRRIDREGSRASTTAEQSNRFLFVDSSSSGQRPRSDQRAINAHIQQTAHRNRKQAAQKQKTGGAANIGRYRREPQLQPRPIEPQPIAPSTLERRETLQPRQSTSPESSSAPRSSLSPPEENVIREPPTPRRLETLPALDREQVDRLRHYSNVRGAEVREAIDAQQHEQTVSTEIARRHPLQDETTSVRSMLTQILQRLDAGHAGRLIQPSPNSSLNNTLLDPFNISSVHITPSMNAALRHFSDVMIPGVFPTRHQAEIQTRWAFQNAAQDPLVLYSLLAIASAERSSRLGELRSGSIETTFTEADLENRTVPDFVSYKVNAVRLANESMKSMDKATQASTIFAMMCLLSIEVITGNQKEIFAHVTGLQKLIAWRGGYHGIPPHATELILSASYMCAALTRSLPAAPPTSALPSLPASLVEEIRQNVSEDVKKMGTGLLTADVDTILDWRISQAFRDMKDVVQYREYYHEKQLNPAPDENEYINAKSYHFRYAALSAPFELREPASDKEEACRLAMLIFWFSNFQVSRPDSALNRTLTAQLKTALQASDLKGLWGPHYELLVWVLLLGAYISAGQRERPWFVLNLARVSRVLKLQTWDQVRQVLLKFFYLDRIYAEGMRQSWEEASLLAETMEAGLS